MDDLISEFITETSESIALLDQELVKLEQNPNDKEILGNIFRLVHTIKGTCGFLGLPRLEAVAHAGENVLGKIRDGVIIVTPQAISMVLEALDTIKGLIEHLAAQGEEPAGEDSDLIARLNAFADSNGASAGAPPADEPIPDVSAMMAPGEGGGKFSQEELDALERAFNEASPTIEGGVDFTKAPEMVFEEPAPPAASLPVAKPALSEQAKEKAIKQGLETDAAAGGAAHTNQSIRVNLDVLENLMQMVGELVLTRNQLMQVMRNRDDRELKGPLQQLSQITTELQESVMKTRMQPIGNAWSKFPRLIRDLANELNKKIDLKMVGESTELDRQVLETIKDPLTHMVRNSCDHGLERPADRTAAGKPETGTVTLRAFHEGGHIIIEIADDGRGINLERVKQKALENGLATEDELAELSDQQIMQFIFKAGFSTAEKVTSVSGRGVGMDVVRTNIEKIGGTVELMSVPGRGSTFHIKIPLTLAIVSVLLVESTGQRFAIPQLNVVELVRVGPETDLKLETINRAPVLRLRDKLLPLTTLRAVLGQPDQVIETDAEAGQYIAVIRVGASDFGLVVDRIHDTEEIVVKPVSHLLEHFPVYAGNTILGDGSVIMILDPNGVGRAMGELDLSPKPEETLRSGFNELGERITSFLIFTSGEGAPKTVPLELVSRLEELAAHTVEHSGEEAVVQYRGGLMRLTTINNFAIPKEGMLQVIVFSYDNRTVGLVVDTIVDILEAPESIKLAGHNPALLGSMILQGKTTEVLDVAKLLGQHAEDVNDADGLRGMSILYAEDSMFFRNLSVPFFEAMGLNVTVANNGAEALKLLHAPGYHFDAIVTDIEMPEMDGLSFAEKALGEPRFAHLPVIAFSSSINELNIARSERIGMKAIIHKNDRALLAETLKKWLVASKEAA